MGILVLRKCIECKTEAINIEDLKNFVPDNKCYFGYSNLCKLCRNKRYRENPSYKKRLNEWRKKYYVGDKRKEFNKSIQLYRSKRGLATFKGKQVLLKKEVRTNRCFNCGKKYPDEIKRKTTLHHTDYSSDNVLDNIIELCGSCHIKLHHKLRGHAVGNIFNGSLINYL